MPEPDQPKPSVQVINVGTLVERETLHPLTIAARPHLWLHWARIAIRQERRAWGARARGLSQREAGPPRGPRTQPAGRHVAAETDEAIQAVTAARHCLHNLWRAWNLGVSEKSLTLARLTTITPASAATWRTRVEQLIDDRNDVVHHDEVTAPAQPHPVYPTKVSGLAASFTAERATEAVDIMMNDVLRLVLTGPSPALQSFANDHGHVLAVLDRQRATGTVW